MDRTPSSSNSHLSHGTPPACKDSLISNEFELDVKKGLKDNVACYIYNDGLTIVHQLY